MGKMMKMFKLKPSDYLPIAVVSLIAFVIIMVWTVGMAVAVSEMYAKYDSSAEGTVTNVLYDTSVGSFNRQNAGYFKHDALFVADSTEYTLQFTDKGLYRRHEGDKVTVLYNAANPKDCTIADVLTTDVFIASVFAMINSLVCSRFLREAPQNKGYTIQPVLGQANTTNPMQNSDFPS